MDVAGFMTKWLQDLLDAQSEDGIVPSVAPNVPGIPQDGGPAWSDAIVICPWTLYLTYGDRRILETVYDGMVKFMEFLLHSSPGYIRCAPTYEGWPGYGDWLSINADTPRDLIGTAFFAYDAHLMAKIAEVLGKSDDAVRYRHLFEQIKQAFGKRYLKGSSVTAASERLSASRKLMDDADAISRGNLAVAQYQTVASEVFNTNLFSPTQTAYVLALHFNLLPDDLRALGVSELVTDIQYRHLHLSTGFVGAPYLPHVLSQNGHLETAYALLFQKTWPSWLYSVTQGATTIWERWDGWTQEAGFQSPDMNSFNHYAYGSIGAWLYNTVAGIEVDPDQPGYKYTVLRPKPGGGLTKASGKLKTPYGDLVSDWSIEGDRFRWAVIVPPNTSATAYLPVADDTVIYLDGNQVRGTVHKLSAGTYRFEGE
jgi:alpha-L-rhamnosidase